MTRRSSRRQFLKQSAAAGLGFWVAGGLSLAGSKAASEKLNFACIGVGGKGDSDCNNVGELGNVVALCDMDEHILDGKAKQFKEARKFIDFREMLETMDKKIDAVTVSTPDHTHAVAAMMAMKMGKHVYCQKPLTHDVYEARQMRETASKMKVATQMGNQGTSLSGLRKAVEWIQAGVLGGVTEVHVWTDRPREYWKQAPDIVARPRETPAIPRHIHWNEFLGPAPERPYHPDYIPMKWRGFRDFGTGALGDMACHTANMAFLALKLGYPISIEAESSEVNPETYQAWATITYQFPARGAMPAVKLVWWEGKKDGQRHLPPAELLKGQKASDSGSLLIGEKGTMYSPNDYGAAFKLLPAKAFENFKAPEERLPRFKDRDEDLNQKREWVQAIKGGPPAMANFDYAALLTESILLGNVAVVAGKKIEYDGAAMRITNMPEANKLLKREYRSGWKL